MITESDIVDVPLGSWADTCAAYREQGLVSVDWLTAVDSRSGFQVLAHLVSPGSGAEVIVRCALPGGSSAMQSLAGAFPGADWHERETAEMFGIEFFGRAECEPLLLRERWDAPPMLRSTALPERVNTPWPGAEEGSARRRRRLPPGVREEWVPADE